MHLTSQLSSLREVFLGLDGTEVVEVWVPMLYVRLRTALGWVPLR